MDLGIEIDSKIIPTDVRIFYEDSKPYMYYIGRAKLSDGTKIQIEIPKMDLTINDIKGEYIYNSFYEGSIEKRIHATKENVAFKITTLEREVSKEQLEKN